MMIRCSFFTAVLAVAALATAHADVEDFALRDGDTVAFLGDSITAAREYSKLVETYTVLRFPERKIRFFNAGMGGETAKGNLNRLEEAVLARPQWRSFKRTRSAGLGLIFVSGGPCSGEKRLR